MFSRTTALLIVILLVPAGLSQTGLQLGEKFEGEITGEKKFIKGLLAPSGNRLRAYTAEIPVTLKAGQKLFHTVTVTGKTRGVGVALRDPSGALVEVAGLLKKSRKKKQEQVFAASTAQLQVAAVSASGNFQIVVLSDQVGAFTLLAKGPAEKLGAAALEAKIKRLEQELEETRALLKKAREEK
jgi:hypothetical protein